MKIRVHADDLGLSRGVNDSILDCADNGVLDGVSLLANGDAFDHAVDALAARPDLRVHAHLNLCEGGPVLPPGDVDLLVNDAGHFRHSFTSLWRAYISAGGAERRALRDQVAAEWMAQAQKVAAALDGRPVGIDSHRHYHAIPFLFDIALDVAEAVRADHVRIPQGPGPLAIHGGAMPLAFPPLNLVKLLLLNVLCRPARRKLAARGLASSDHFIGVLHGGAMKRSVVGASLAAVHRRAAGVGDATVEVLFHPGSVAEDEGAPWPDAGPIAEFYCSSDRRREADELKHPEMAEILTTY